MEWAIILLISVHALFIAVALYGWKKALSLSLEPSESSISVDVLIPFRNEHQNIKELIHDIKDQKDLDNVRLFFIDDHSSDGSTELVKEMIEELPACLLISEGEGKKAALDMGFKASIQPHILTMDADVRLPREFFSKLTQLPSREDMVILPVLPKVKGGLCERYAGLDFMSLIGITFAAAGFRRPIMANGANLLRLREAFHLDTSTASGDDVQNLHHLKKSRSAIGWSLNSSLSVRTIMPDTWTALLDQRLRWASKSTTYQDSDTLIIGRYMLAHQISFILLIVALLIQAEAEQALYLILFKGVLDFLFLFIITAYFKLSGLLWVFPMALILNVFMYPIIFIASKWPYTWKDRTYSS